MSLFRRGWDAFDPSAPPPNSSRSPWTGRFRRPDRDQAMRLSAVWAALRLRADLISTMPIDVFRKVQGVQIEMPKPPVLISPSGDDLDMVEWMYSTQVDLDSCGNTFGIITERSGAEGDRLPSRIELVPYTDVVVQKRDGKVTYRIAGTKYEPADVWHERQYTVSGIPVGLSPLAYGAMALGTGLSAQEFASAWFDAGGAPTGILRNKEKKLEPGEAATAKLRFKESTAARDVFVTGKDWDYAMVSAKASESSYVEQSGISATDAARYLGVPGDVIDAAVSGSSVTYANITQRNLQLLVLNLGPAIVRRETALSRRLLPAPRFVKLNSDALLRMDPMQRAEMLNAKVAARTLAPSEARALDNLEPFTPDQLAEFATLFPSKAPTPGTGTAPNGATS